MPTQGTLICFAHTSDAILPLQDVTITITQRDAENRVTLLAVRTTDRSGKTQPVRIDAPPAADSQTNEPGRPFASVDIAASLSGYEQIVVEDVQLFSGITTVQNLAMIPLSELPDLWNRSETFHIPAQNL